MARGCIFGFLLLGLGRSARIGDQQADRVVFGEVGDTISFLAPDLPRGSRRCTWPTTMPFNRKVYLLGGVTERIGFAVKDFQREDQGTSYTITNGRRTPIRFRAVVVNRVEVDVYATLYISLDQPWTINSITWKYTPTSTTKSTDFVSVFDKFKSRARVNATTGKLSIIDWRSGDDGFFVAEINGQQFAENFKVRSIVRVEPGHDLILAPNFVGSIGEFSWYRDNILLVQYIQGTDVVYKFPHCNTKNGNCNFDTQTGKLTVKSWHHAFDGEFTMMINGKLTSDKIKVVGDVYFAPFNEKLTLDLLPPWTQTLNSISWQYDGNLAAEYHTGGDVDYYQECKNEDEDTCVLDKTTGKLTLLWWYPFETKRWSVVFNNNKQAYEYLVAGVGKLALVDATLTLQTLSDTKKLMICDGDFDGAEPVTYFWRLHGTTDNWVQGTKFMETKNIYQGPGRTTYSYDACKMVNPVSERVLELN